MPKKSDRSLRHRKIRDRALILPVIGLFLLTPPVAGIFEIHADIAGVPVILVYVFSVWAGLIAVAAILYRPLRDADRTPGFEDIPAQIEEPDA